ncbi:MAG TPA: hypothetical protein VMR25_00355 [Planctomycetaceae bacterium]|jgi:hypothetical protein|nr:hypothetical protein [Planctomycetaceae bacterium]
MASKLFMAQWGHGPNQYWSLFSVEPNEIAGKPGIEFVNSRSESIRHGSAEAQETDRFIDVLYQKVDAGLPPEQAIREAEEAVPATPLPKPPMFWDGHAQRRLCDFNVTVATSASCVG